MTDNYVIKSSSMMPTLKPGDSVLINTSQDPDVGDIVCFLLPTTQTPVIHRVIKIKNKMMITIGDNCLIPDQVIPLTSISGIVVLINPENKTPPFKQAPQSIWKRTVVWFFIYYRFFKFKIRFKH